MSMTAVESQPRIDDQLDMRLEAFQPDEGEQEVHVTQDEVESVQKRMKRRLVVRAMGG
jgi:hypothetical protein